MKIPDTSDDRASTDVAETCSADGVKVTHGVESSRVIVPITLSHEPVSASVAQAMQPFIVISNDPEVALTTSTDELASSHAMKVFII